MNKIPFLLTILTAVSIVLSAFLFVQLVELMVRIVKLYECSSSAVPYSKFPSTVQP